MSSMRTPGPCGRLLMGVVGLSALAGVAVSRAQATDWIEPRSNDLDAGEFYAEAQIPQGVGELESISGILNGVFGGPNFGGGGPPPPADYQDLFLIKISVPSIFSARTVASGFIDFNTELFLFSASGLGLLNNNDIAPGTALFSQLVPAATDGTFTLTTPGLYVIGVAGAGNSPTATGLPIFNSLSQFEVSGPDGPGAANPHDGWVTNPVTGFYRIELTGAEYVPTPGGAALLTIGALAAFRRRR